MNEKQRSKLMGVLVEHQNEFAPLTTAEAQRVIKNPKESIAGFVKAVRERSAAAASNPYLCCISGDEQLIIDAVDGREILADATDVFAYIDPDFKNCNADEPGPATNKTPSVVYEMTKDGAFADLFGSLRSDILKLCFTQAQIKRFMKKHRNWLRIDGYGTFFLFQSKGEFFVASAGARFGGLLVCVLRFGFSGVWFAGYRHRLVAPQLAI